MKNRDKWITIAFLVFILTIPLVTVAGNMLPRQQEAGLTDAEKAVLEKNGTLTKDEENTGVQEVAAQQNIQPKETGFAGLQRSINNFTDGLFGRTKLIALNTELTSLLTGGTYIESTQTLKGKNNMFFYKTENDGHPIWDYMGINHFSEEEMAAIAANLMATREHLEAKGIEFYTMCIPNKEIIYEENMPDTIARVNKVSRGEQLADYMLEHTDLVFVYPKDALMANKDKIQLYYSTDSHSNMVGSFVNMQEFFRIVYGTHAEIDSVKFRTDVTDYAGDLVVMAGLDEKYSIDTVYAFEPDSADKAQYHDQVLLFVGDSFGGFLSQVCKGYYREVYWEDARDFQYSMLDRYNPDVVIWERAERYCEVFAEPILIK
ncbi:MAG: hypothetical protein K2K74_09835 [Lachnospiraceae bacterium]|nr:hypothetical protein [Lachnospiraceae bacterium]